MNLLELLYKGPQKQKKRKRMGRYLAVLGAVLLAAAWPGTVNVQAAEYDGTTYQVIIYSGDKGTFNGTGCVSGAGTATLERADMIVVSDLHYGDTVNIRVSGTNGTVDLDPEDGGKYQPTGTRRSGRDNSEAFDRENATSPSRVYTVTGDRTFVVTYSVPGNMIPYSVSYVLQGTETPVPGSETETFYGVAGEKPVVSAPYFDGYTPVYRAVTGTLVRGQENAWVFEYTRNETPAAGNDTTQEGENQTGTTGTGTATGTENAEGTGTEAAGNNPAGTGTEDTGDNPAGTGAEGAGNAPEIEDHGTDNVPETEANLLDLDDEQTPLGDVELDDSEKETEESVTQSKEFPTFAVIGTAAVIGLIMLAGLLIKRRKSL